MRCAAINTGVLLTTFTIKCETFYMASPIHSKVKVSTWEELKLRVEQLIKELPRSPDGQIPTVLFRGHKDADWLLTTTLERTGEIKQIDVVDYYELAASVYAEVVSKSEESLTFPPIQEIRSTLDSAYSLRSTPLPGLDYLIHLRHHGFPSPLLDWTHDLYTAAFFAFSDSTFTGARSIYIFSEFPNWVKGGWERAEPSIIGLSHQISQLKRHTRQKAEYTVCVDLYGHRDYWSFSEHNAVLNLTQRHQDSLMCFVIPGHQAEIVRAELDSKGIRQDAILPPVELDKCMEKLVERVFGPAGLAQKLKIR